MENNLPNTGFAETLRIKFVCFIAIQLS